MIRQEFESTFQSIPEDDPILQGKSTDERDRMARFVAVTEKPNRTGSVVEVAGWDVEHWMKNPVILWGHSYHEPPIGRGVRIQKMLRPRQLLLDVEFTPEDVNPFGAMVGRMVKSGFLRAVSVGFLPQESEPMDKDDEWGARRYKKQELLEVSVVTVPMDPYALATLNSADQDLLRAHGDGPVVTSVLFTMDTPPEQMLAWLKEHNYAVKDDAISERLSPTGVKCFGVTVAEELILGGGTVRVAPDAKNVALVYGYPAPKPSIAQMEEIRAFWKRPTTMGNADQGVTYVSVPELTQHEKELIEVHQKTLVVLDNVTQAQTKIADVLTKVDSSIRGLNTLAELLSEDRPTLPPPGKKPVGDPAEKFVEKVKEEAGEMLKLFGTM